MYVLEDLRVGTVITRIEAEDPDLDSQLRFGIDYKRSEARSEDGRRVPAESWQVRRLNLLDSLERGLEGYRQTYSIDR